MKNYILKGICLYPKIGCILKVNKTQPMESLAQTNRDVLLYII